MKKFLLSFIFCAAALLAVASETDKAFYSKFRTDKAAYDLLVFSDWHYTDMKFHKLDPKRKWVIPQAERYAGLWKDFSLKTMQAASAHKSDFVLTLGDNLEGYFKSPEAQAEALTELDALVKKYLKRPWISIVGNHEYSPPANRDAYFATAAKLGVAPASRSFHLRYGKDLYIFWDNISARLAPIKLALQEHKDARYTFLICHYPVLPVGSRSTRWIAFGDKSRDQERRELLKILAARQAIVLCGHAHIFSFAEYTSEEGKFTQVVLNSTVDSFSWLKPKQIKHDAEFPFLQKQDYRRVKNIPEFKAFLAEYKGKMSGTKYYNAVGYGVLKISDTSVSIDIYSGVEKKPFAVWQIRKK